MIRGTVFLGALAIALLVSCTTLRAPKSCPLIRTSVTGYYSLPTGVVRTVIYFKFINSSDRAVRVSRYALLWAGNSLEFSPGELIVPPRGSFSWSASYEATPGKEKIPEVRAVRCSSEAED